MTKMSKTQQTAILDFHNGATGKAYTMIASARTIAVLVRNGWATYQVGATARLRRHYPERSAFVTRAGLIAAGVDMDAIHAEALTEYREVTRAARQADSAAYQRELQRGLALKVKADVEPIAVGDTVVRVGEEGVEYPRGKVTEIETYSIGRQAQVSWAGLAPMGIALEKVRKVDPTAEQVERDAHSSACWERATEGVERRPAFAPSLTDDLTTVMKMIRAEERTVREMSDAMLALDRIATALQSAA